ncbi:MAG: lipopolysaccharide biosynthesis protein [Actinomycetota bacterium]
MSDPLATKGPEWRGLSLLLVSTLVGSAAMTFALLAWGRWVGPRDFARYSVAYSLAGLLSIPAGYGIGSATMRLFAQRGSSSGEVRKGRMALSLFGIVSGLLAVAALASGSILADHLRIERSVVTAGVVLGVATSLILFAEYVLKGTSRTGSLAWLRLFVAVSFVASMGIVLLVFPPSFLGPVAARGLPSFIAGGVVAFAILRPAGDRGGTGADEAVGAQPEARPTTLEAGQFLRFAVGAAVASSASIFLLYVDKLVLVWVLPLREVGVYSGYFLGSYLLLARASEVFISILFPRAVRHERGSNDQVRRLVRMGIPIAFVVALAGQFASLRILGGAFGLSWSLAAMFAIGVSFFVVADARWWLVAGAEGVSGVRRFGWNAVIVVLVVAGGMLTLPRILGLHGAALTLCGASLYSFLASGRPALNRALEAQADPVGPG